MAYDFFSHKPEVALIEVKEALYARLETLKAAPKSEAVDSEIKFLYTLLDRMERS